MARAPVGGALSFAARDRRRRLVFACDEGFRSPDGNGSLVALREGPDGALRELARRETLPGPVYLELFGPRDGSVAVPHL